MEGSVGWMYSPTAVHVKVGSGSGVVVMTVVPLEAEGVVGGRFVVALTEEEHEPTTHILTDSWKQALAAHV